MIKIFDKTAWWEKYPNVYQRSLVASILSKVSSKNDISDIELNALLDIAIEKRMFVVRLLQKIGVILTQFDISTDGLELPKSSVLWYETYPKEEDNQIALSLHNAIRNNQSITFDDIIELLDIMRHDIRLETAVINTYENLRAACIEGLQNTGVNHFIVPGNTVFWDSKKIFVLEDTEE